MCINWICQWMTGMTSEAENGMKSHSSLVVSPSTCEHSLFVLSSAKLTSGALHELTNLL